MLQYYLYFIFICILAVVLSQNTKDTISRYKVSCKVFGLGNWPYVVDNRHAQY